MNLAWLEVRDLRNHRETRLELSDGLGVVVGANAQGKTNLLEAVHYLCTLRSPRVSVDEPLVRWGADSAFLRCELQTATGKALVEVEVRRSGANRVRMNGSGVRRKRDLRTRARSVFFIPEDLAIVQGEPEERRRFLDQAAEALWPATEVARTSFEKALRQRNRLLKEHEGVPPGLEGWDAELVTHGSVLTEARARAVSRLAPESSDVYRAVSGDALTVEYRPSVEAPEGGTEEAFRNRLAERRSDELTRRRTLVGPHRDELHLAVGDLAARRFASHGETWAAALCLRLGLGQAVAAEISEQPVLLLDDPFSGLDPERRRRLTDALVGRGQVLLAVPDEAHVPPGARVWEVSGGQAKAR